MKVASLCSLPLLAGFVLDLILGDPHWFYHPVRLIGNLIAALERLLRKLCPIHPRAERIAGGVLAAAVPLITLVVVAGFLLIAAYLNVWLWFFFELMLCYLLLAVRSLRDESMAVYQWLDKNNLPQARRALSRIVGRDTDMLDEPGVIRAAVETVAENTCDGVVAPIFYVILGGAPLGWFYKSVNTLDSMVGYRDERYRYFGTASARLDDLLNLLPARLAALCMTAASAFCGFSASNAFLVWRRDRYNHQSPNSAQTEAVCAGALGIQLAGGGSYSGVWKDKPTIGDDMRPVEPADIIRANRLMQTTAFIFLGISGILRTAAIALLFRQLHG